MARVNVRSRLGIGPRQTAIVALFDSPRSALADGLRSLVAAVEQTGQGENWLLRLDSPAATDWVQNERPCRSEPQPLQDAYQTGTIGWYNVADQALSVADLLESGRTLGVLAASRALAEAACRSAYLLADDVAPTHRIGRLFNDRLYALHEQRRFAAAIPGVDDAWQRPAAADLIAAATELGLPIEAPREDRAGWVGTRRPSTMTILGELIGHPDYAAGFYRDTSAVAHATLHGLVRRTELRFDSNTGYRSTVRRVPTAELVIDIQPAIAAFAHQTRLLVTQAGWAQEEWAAASDELAKITAAVVDSTTTR